MKGLILAIDIGGTKVHLGLVNLEGQVLQSTRFPTLRGTLANFGSLLVTEVALFLQQRDPIVGIGIGAKGRIDITTNRYVSGSLFTEAAGFDLCKALSETFNVPAFIENDLNATVLAEARWGSGNGKENFMFINIGTGFGVGVMDGRQLVRGSYNFAGEVGNCLLKPTAKRPYIHTFESIVSGGGIDKEVRRIASSFPQSIFAEQLASSANPILSRELFAAYRAGDKLAIDLVDDMVEYLAYMLINLEYAFNSQYLIFGGGVISDSWFFDQVEKRTMALMAEAGRPWRAQLFISTLGSLDAALLGAASVYLHKSTPIH